MNSCEYLEYNLENIFSETLDKWNIPYVFTALDTDKEPVFQINNTICRGNRIPERFPIKVGYKDAFWQLTICS
jgi:hypothetical protein